MAPEVYEWISSNFGALAGGVFICWIVLSGLLAVAGGHRKDRRRIANWIEHFHTPYRRTMNAVMRAISFMVLPDTREDNPKPKDLYGTLVWAMEPRANKREDWKNLIVRPWSWPVMSMAIKLAMIYPFLFAMVQWVITAEPVKLGAVSLFEPNIPAVLRYVILFAALLALLFWAVVVLMSRLDTRGFELDLDQETESFVVRVFIRGLWFTGGIYLAGMAASYFSGSGDLFTVIALGVVLASAIVSGGYLMSLITGMGIIISMPGVALLRVTAGAMSIFALGASTAWLTARGYGAFGHGLIWIFCAAASMNLLWLLEPTGTFAAIVFTFAFLPVLNSIFDWLSYGLTIWLLRWGQEGQGVLRPLFAGVVDAVGALALFAALSSTMVLALSLFASLRGFDPYGIVAVLDDPFSHPWILLMVGSTLLPTLTHLMLALFSVTTLIPLPFWRWLAHGLDKDESALGNLAASAAIAAGVIVVYPGTFVFAGWSLGFIWAQMVDLIAVYASFLSDLRSWAVDTFGAYEFELVSP